MIDPYALPQVQIPEGVIHLGIGQPTADLLPGKPMASAWHQALDTDETFFMAYGEDRGNMNFRQTLARFLSQDTDGMVDPDQLMITNGNSQALDFICKRFTRPGDTIFTEDPSYFLALRIFEDHQLNVIGLPMDDSGLVADGLDEMIRRHHPRLLYTIPTHHNPAAVTLSDARRRKLVEICAAHDVMVVADEVYHFLTFEGPRPLSLGMFCENAPVLSLGSFSKIMAPGLRLGWIRAGRKMIKKMAQAGVIVSGGGFNPFTSQMVDTFIRSGCLEKNITELNRIYSSRMAVMCDSLETVFNGSVRFFRPAGGYFIWLELPDAMDAAALRDAARRQGVDFYAGQLFSPAGANRNRLRLAFSFYKRSDIQKGIQRLGRAFGI